MRKGLNKLDVICARLQTSVNSIPNPDEAGDKKDETSPTNQSKDNIPLKPTAEQVSESTSRRKSRKSTNPRNIQSLSLASEGDYDKDEISEYEINNRGVDFSPFINQNGGDLEDSACDSAGNDNIPLSCNNYAKAEEQSPQTENQIIISKEPVAQDVVDPVDATNNIPEGSKKEMGNSADAATLKNYAQDTVNELLSIYGLGNEAENITQSVPLQNFSSRKILERTTPISKHKAGHDDGSRYKKFMENMTKIQEMPEGYIVANPPVLLPNGSSCPNTPGTTTHSLSHTPKTGSGKKNKYLTTPDSKSNSPSSSTYSPGRDDNPDYTRYLKRFPNYQECGGNHCQDMNYREHYHCLDCSYRVFIKKEEMIRHYKWHKKRDDSLQHGFMRYSPLDDCTNKFGPCTHYGKQTHYHCLQSGCDKVYISTSDVQMHANYHRKASAIISEGFQRFRATEDCGTPLCQFYGQRTTHFHCRRTGCKFTFKNKADMEKHKSYHQKDEILSKDGFKKFMKYELCGFDMCKYSKVSNHIHCIRPGCDYVLHSTGQLYSHKRKHERKDFELAYQEYRSSPAPISEPTNHIPPNRDYIKLEELVQMSKQERETSISTTSDSQNSSVSASPGPPNSQEQVINLSKPGSQSSTNSPLIMSEAPLDGSLNLPIPHRTSDKLEELARLGKQQEAPSVGGEKKDEMWRDYLVRYTANDHCHSRCELLYKDHYHCQSDGCNQMFRSKEGVRDHARLHKFEQSITDYSYKCREANEVCDEIACRYNLKEKHYHCSVPNCSAVLTETEPYERIKHFKTHEIPNKFVRMANRTAGTVADALKRKRGRPPKFARDIIPVVPRPIAPSPEGGIKKESGESDPANIFEGFKLYEVGEVCPDVYCMFYARIRHWHCLQPRCHHATDRVDIMNIHKKDFHGYINIRPGFEFFDRNINCRRAHCHNNKANRHFHCIRQKCDYSFVRHTTMEQHEKRHSGRSESDTPNISPKPPPSQAIPVSGTNTSRIAIDNASVVKSAGTFFPQNLIGQPQPVNTTQAIQIIQTTAGPIAVTIPNLGLSFGGSVQPSIVAGQVVSSTLAPNTVTTSSESTESRPNTLQTVGGATHGILPLTMLLQKKVQMPKLDWLGQLSKMHFSMAQNCGRPFCKLKKRNHYHCSECNQAFTEELKVRAHIHNKHRNQVSGDEAGPAKKIKLEHSDTEPSSPQVQIKQEESSRGLPYDEEDSLDNLNFSNIFNVSDDVLDTSSSSFTTTKSGRKRKKSWKFIETDPSKPKQTRSPRSEKIDLNVPEGYIRVRFDENCAEEKCSYRQLHTHYHCIREDCKYGFSDRSRILPHTLRHERIDKIMGTDFRQFRGNLDCLHEGCEFRQKSSHFHCLKCEFLCCDTNRVIGHRKHHSKMDGYNAQGFRKITGTQDCEVENCVHKMKQTHYHCIQGICTYGVLTPSHMAPHKFKHELEAKMATINRKSTADM